jgi:hypothetical protein
MKNSSKKSFEDRESRLEPRFSSELADAGIFCPDLMANIHCGGTLQFKNCLGGSRIGRVLDILAHDQVLMSICPLVDYRLFHRSPFTIESLRTNEEVYQSRNIEEVATSRITGIVFIVTQTYIEEHNTDLCGINNVYTIRYQEGINNDNKLDEIPQGNLKPFPLLYAEHFNRCCVHRELLNSLNVLRRSLLSALNRKEPANAVDPIGVSYQREPISPLY